MTLAETLSMLKMNLEIVNTIQDNYLTNLLEISKNEIIREGIDITVENNNYSLDDASLMVMYAAYLYRNRATDQRTIGSYNTAAFASQGMPRMLRYALNNRLLAQKMSEGTN